MKPKQNVALAFYTVDGVHLIPFGQIDTVSLTAEEQDMPENFKVNTESNFTVELTNAAVFDELAKMVQPDRFNLQYTALVPRRKHKKKRIAKKWAKRYGYKEVERVIKNVRVDNES